METKPINPANGKKKTDKQKVAANAATIVGGAGLGVTAAAVASEINQIDDTDDIVNPEEMQDGEATANGGEAEANGGQTADGGQQPSVGEGATAANGAASAGHAAAGNGGTGGAGGNAAESGDVDPDEIAEAVISENEVDPNDLDMANVVNFDSLGEVHTVNGESYTAAAFHDDAGNNLVMIDVDNDNTFDIVADANGNPIADAQGNPIPAGNLTVDDAEMSLNDGDNYLAHNDSEQTDDFGSDTIADDILS